MKDILALKAALWAAVPGSSVTDLKKIPVSSASSNASEFRYCDGTHTLTEASQGKDVFMYASGSDVD